MALANQVTATEHALRRQQTTGAMVGDVEDEERQSTGKRSERQPGVWLGPPVAP